MSMGGEAGIKMVQLHSDDGASTVVDWYKTRLGVTKATQIFGQTFLEAGELKVMIFGDEGGAQIMITRGDVEK